jgi:hypothetical protein
MKEIEINGELFVKKDSIKSKKENIENWITKNKKGKTLCVVRTYSAGVFYGYVDYEAENTYTNYEVFDVSQIYKWGGKALTLLEVATTEKVSSSKLSVKVPVLKLNRVIKIIPMTQDALKNIEKCNEKL